MAIPDLDFGLNFEEDEEPIDQNFWSNGLYYVYDTTLGEFVPADPQPDPPEVFMLSPEGLIVPAY